MNELIDFAKSNLLSLRRCCTSVWLISAVGLAGCVLLLLRQFAPLMWAELLGCVIQVSAFVGATAFLAAPGRHTSQQKLQDVLTLTLSMVLVHFALLAVTVWPSVEMIPFIAHVASGTPLFFLLGVMPAALLAPVIRYSHFQIMVGTVLGLPMLFLLAGAGSFIQGSAWATPLVRAVFDVAIGMAAGAGYFAAESKLRELQY